MPIRAGSKRHKKANKRNKKVQKKHDQVHYAARRKERQQKNRTDD